MHYIGMTECKRMEWKEEFTFAKVRVLGTSGDLLFLLGGHLKHVKGGELIAKDQHFEGDA